MLPLWTMTIGNSYNVRVYFHHVMLYMVFPYYRMRAPAREI
jgi:hypothetical protein